MTEAVDEVEQQFAAEFVSREPPSELGCLFVLERDGSLTKTNANLFAEDKAAAIVHTLHDNPEISTKYIDVCDGADRKELVKVAADMSLFSFSANAEMAANRSSSVQNARCVSFMCRKLDNFTLKEEELWYSQIRKDFRIALENLPTHYDGERENRMHFFDFFRAYGTHYVKIVSTGAQLILDYQKSGVKTSDEIQFSSKARLGQLIGHMTVSASGKFESELKEEGEVVSFQCRGGKEQLLEFKEQEAKEWLAKTNNIRNAPSVVERKLVEIYHLVHGRARRIALLKALDDFRIRDGSAVRSDRVLRRGASSSGLEWKNCNGWQWYAHISFVPSLDADPNWAMLTAGYVKDGGQVSLRVDRSTLNRDGMTVSIQRPSDQFKPAPDTYTIYWEVGVVPNV